MHGASGGRRATFWKSFGPGLLWAATAIGVSHVVQSTRAGADAGFALAGVILVALVLKYPFFEFGPRYAAATGASLVEGYRRVGRWALGLYLAITLTTAGIVQTAVLLVTAFLLQYLFGSSWSTTLLAGLLVTACALLLWIGRFRTLDLTVKAMLVVLAMSTLGAAFVTLPRADFSTLSLWPGEAVGRLVPFAFLLALVGWMPSAIDISVWSSLWTVAKDEVTATRVSVETAKLDFLIGYVGTGVLAFAFLTLGAGVMYGAGVELSGSGAIFATQVVDLYSETLGAWTRPIVLAAVTTTMLSTSLTVVDGFPRAIDRSFANLVAADAQTTARRPVGPLYWISIAGLGLMTVIVLLVVAGNLTTMVDFATIVSFLTAPILGFLNLKAVTSRDVPVAYRPGPAMRALAWVGLVLLGGTGAGYLVWLFG